jgi:hypothetical protein
MHGAGAALRNAATVFRTGEANGVAQRPEERCIGLKINLMLRPVDCDRDHLQDSRETAIC